MIKNWQVDNGDGNVEEEKEAVITIETIINTKPPANRPRTYAQKRRDPKIQLATNINNLMMQQSENESVNLFSQMVQGKEEIRDIENTMQQVLNGEDDLEI